MTYSPSYSINGHFLALLSMDAKGEISVKPEPGDYLFSTPHGSHC
jgi:hypothetical protein